MSVNSKTAVSFLFFSLCLLAVPLFPQEERFRTIAQSWPTATRGVVFALASAALLTLLGVAVMEISKTVRRRRAREHDHREKFEALCRKAGLNGEESALLRRFLHHSRPPDPSFIFKNAKFFEVGVEKEIQATRSPQDLQFLNDTLAALRRKMDFSSQTGDASLFSSRQLSPGQKLTLASDGGETAGASIADVTETEFTVRLSKGKEEAPGFSPGASVSVSFIRPGDAEYGFSTRVKARRGEGMLAFAHVTGIRRRQLREYLRIDVKLEAALRLIRSDADPERAKGAERVRCALNDLSGGGAALRTAEEFAPGDLISLSFNFMGESFAGIKAKVLRVVARTGQGENLFQHHVQFLEIENRMRERLIRLIFDKHRENLQWQ